MTSCRCLLQNVPEINKQKISWLSFENRKDNWFWVFVVLENNFLFCYYLMNFLLDVFGRPFRHLVFDIQDNQTHGFLFVCFFPPFAFVISLDILVFPLNILFFSQMLLCLSQSLILGVFFFFFVLFILHASFCSWFFSFSFVFFFPVHLISWAENILNKTFIYLKIYESS